MAGTPLEPPEAQAREIIARLRLDFPQVGVVLTHHDPWQLTVAVILSAQSTDKTVNQVTERLFQKYRALEDFASADPAEFEQDIHATGFFRNKTKHILGAARMILTEFGGRVPDSMAELLRLPGVARKTANIILGNAYPEAYARDPDAGIAVDTHVHRLANRLGLARSKDPVKTEAALLPIVPRQDWFQVSYLLIEHGRAVCAAKKPRCALCRLADICPSAGVF